MGLLVILSFYDMITSLQATSLISHSSESYKDVLILAALKSIRRTYTVLYIFLTPALALNLNLFKGV